MTKREAMIKMMHHNRRMHGCVALELAEIKYGLSGKDEAIDLLTQVGFYKAANEIIDELQDVYPVEMYDGTPLLRKKA